MKTRAACLATLALTAAPMAQDARCDTEPVPYTWFSNTSLSNLQFVRSQGMRIVDFEPTAPGRYGVTLVRRTGAYAARSWLYTNLSAQALGLRLATNKARLIDLEVVRGGSDPRFDAVMVDNTGKRKIDWTWVWGRTYKEIEALYKSRNMRIIHLQRYRVGFFWRYAAVLVQNTGRMNKVWAVRLGITSTHLSRWCMQNGMRIYHLERRSDGRYDSIAVKANKTRWSFYTNADKQLAERLRSADNARIIDIEKNGDRLDIVTIFNGGSATGFGSACPGSNAKRPVHGAVTEWPARQRFPVGARIGFEIADGPATGAAALMLGFDERAWGRFTLPLPLAFLGAPGCSLYVPPTLLWPTALASGRGKVTLRLPLVADLVAARLHTQYLVLDPPVNAAGITTSNGLTVVLGPRH